MRFLSMLLAVGVLVAAGARADELLPFVPDGNADAKACRAAYDADRRDRTRVLQGCAFFFKAPACASAIRASAAVGGFPSKARTACCEAYAARLRAPAQLCAGPIRSTHDAWEGWEELIGDVAVLDWKAGPTDHFRFSRWFVPALVPENAAVDPALSRVLTRVTLKRVDHELQGLIGPPLSAVGVPVHLGSAGDVAPLAAMLRGSGLNVQVRLEPSQVSFEEVERAREALRRAGFDVLPPPSSLQIRLAKQPNGVLGAVGEAGFPAIPVWLGEAADATPLLEALRMWAPRATLSLEADTDVPAAQVAALARALEHAGLKVRKPR